MAIEALDIVQIQVNDWPAAVRWYQEKLGFRVLVQEADDQIAFLALPGDETCKLALWGTGGVNTSEPSRCYPCLRVSDLDQTLAELRRNGVEFSGKVEGGDDKGFRGVRALDCERNAIFLYAWSRR